MPGTDVVTLPTTIGSPSAFLPLSRPHPSPAVAGFDSPGAAEPVAEVSVPPPLVAVLAPVPSVVFELSLVVSVPSDELPQAANRSPSAAKADTDRRTLNAFSLGCPCRYGRVPSAVRLPALSRARVT